MIKKLWKAISDIGIQPGYNEKKRKRVALINQFTVVAALIYVVNGISDFSLGFYDEATLLEISALFFVVPLYLNKMHLHKATVVFLFVFISLTVFYFGTLAGVQSGDYLYYFPLIMAISFAFDFSKDKILMVMLFIFILVLIIINTFAYTEFPVMAEAGNTRYQMFVVNLFFSAITLGAFVFITAKNNDKVSQLYEQKIKQKEESEVLIKKALQEKEVLLAELHHRVKNNLAVMVGFFNLKLNSTANEDAREILLESRNRVNSMALIHNHLYRKEDVTEINFSPYIIDLVNEIKTSYPAIAKSVIVHSNIVNIKLSLNAAIPCALILNELLTNCYKHAFKDGEQGTIHIDFTPFTNQQLKLKVKDNGRGLGKDFKQHESMGLTVIESLSQQLNATHRYLSEQGTCFELEFDPALV
ncbi:MAG TPA: sensor histidine kinase [Bacteroidia bacterium]|nr:sensor histidine kinase [Bacteroidia bacterium]